jgi:hypothetical protein
MVEVTIVTLQPVAVLLLQRNFVRGVSLGKSSKGGFGPIGPEGHVDGAVQLDGGGELGTGLFPSAEPGRQHAETEVIVGPEWAHAEFYSTRHGLLVNTLSPFDLWGLLTCMDFAEQPKGPGLVPPLLTLAGEIEGTPSELDCVIHPPCQQIGFTQIGNPECMVE